MENEVLASFWDLANVMFGQPDLPVIDRLCRFECVSVEQLDFFSNMTTLSRLLFQFDASDHHSENDLI